jgi:hypothetical protein
MELTKTTFDELLSLLQEMRNDAANRKDWRAYKKADRADALLHQFATDLIVEGRVPEAYGGAFRSLNPAAQI